ncbi:hydroxymethylglutaryl-CoA synthase family protein [Marinibaculum pumilum]|uniref:Hydroxymethylglutaryl-CoA synthase family protein n=1 Tax=Marinibaculum pumilum TaxID=1766165 RepID=A0ABV7L5L8_9PROT
MASIGITAYGGYIPRLRLDRKTVAAAHAWAQPGLRGRGKGERSMCHWDEDTVTMAVEAGRDCLTGIDPAMIGGLALASTTLPFADRQNAAIVATALGLDRQVASADIAGSQRAALAALRAALGQVAVQPGRGALCVASEHRITKPASVQELITGDGAAALAVGSDGVIAEFLGAGAVTADFVDHFRESGADFDYGWEERWVREEGYQKFVPAAVKAALAEAGVEPGAVNHFVMPCIFPKLAERIAKGLGIDEGSVADTLDGVCGETGAAHPLVMLAHCLETAKAGEVIVVAGFGQGADALVFRTTDALAKLPKRIGIGGYLKHRKEETNYLKFLSFNGHLAIDWGMRAEQDTKTALTSAWRNVDMVGHFDGGRCTRCGTVQFPKTRICVNPNCQETDTQEPYSFADKTGQVASFTADWLTHSYAPPLHFGAVTFAEGGKVTMEMTDDEVGAISIGQDMRMVYRIKDFDFVRGYRRYFWKAAPAIGG